jgi:hypothetical protein
MLRATLALGQRLLAWVVLLLSGAYLLIYLYRWEWNRAIISGIFFIAAEVPLAASMILRRLQVLERSPSSPAAPAVLDRLRSTTPDRPQPFAWLSPRDGRLGVFVPVLLGAGVIISACAYVVERVAEATALPLVDRRLARRLSALAPPTGGLLAPGGVTAPDQPRRARWSEAVTTALALAAIGVLVWLGVQALIETAQARPDPADRPVRTTIELSIQDRGFAGTPVAAAEAFWVDCGSTVGFHPTTGQVVGLRDDRVLLVLEPGIGRLGIRRLTGCLSDLRLSLVRATVLDVESTY